MRPTPDSVKREVLRLWFEGATYREIAAREGLSLGVISKIIEEYRQKASDIDELRRLYTALKQASLPDALRGARFLQTLDESGFDSKYLPQCLDFIKKAGEGAPKLAVAGTRLIDLERNAGKPYEQLLKEFNERIKAEAELSGRVRGLEDRELKLRASILHLEKLTALQETIAKHNLTPNILERLISDGLNLQKLGFTTQQAEILAKELAKRGLDPATASAQVAKLLQESRDLEDAKNKAEAEAKKQSLALNGLTSNIESTKEELNLKKELLQKLEESYHDRKELLQKEYQALESKLQAEHDRKKQILEIEIQGLENKAALLKTEVEDLESAKAFISIAEDDLETIQQSINKRKTLFTIVSLIENPAALKTVKEVPEVMLTILKGFQNYLGESKQISFKNKMNLLHPVGDIMKVLVEELPVGTVKTQS
ncbi:MAG: hypothetical protein ABSF09_06820 [Candidatus Bathyarchaeia archaeon]|jgi:hypothetical protein